MPTQKKSEKSVETEQKLYLVKIPKKPVYWALGLLLVVALGLFLMVPHYKPVHEASAQQSTDAHKAIIDKFFVRATTCVNDTQSHADQIKTFNKYFKVNEYANRAVIRGCNDADSLLATDDSGQWQRTDVNITLNTRQNPQWQKACYIADITVADTKVRPENSSIDASNLKICNSLAKQSYIELNWNVSIHLHF